MGNAAHDTYLEERVLSADPVELVCMVYQGAIDAVEDARRYLATGQVAARSRAVSKACGCVLELGGSLDKERGGDLSRRLAELYDYLVRRLMEANLAASEAPLAEVQSLLSTLAEAWREVSPRGRHEIPEPGVWAQPAMPEAEPAYAPPSQERYEVPQPSPWAQPPIPEAVPVYASQSWSF
jgi:flagellar protein FliS